MNVEVRLIYFSGRVLKKTEREKMPPARGKLRVVENRLHTLGRVVNCASLVSVTDGLETSLLPDLLDAQLIWLDDKQMRLRGTEIIDGVMYGQTWDIKVL